MVATVTRLSEAASTVHYFEADGYYAKNDAEHRKASRWHGRGVKALGLHGPVKPRRFEEVLSGRIPGTKTRLGRLRDGKHEHRPGLDITFSAPKSVSLEALVHAAPKASARIVRAHDEAVTATLDFIERELLETRGWDPVTRKRPRIKAEGLVAATFRHYASRNLDPQLHTHSVVANMTRNPEGEWRSADFIRIERAKLLIGAHYRAELRRRIEALGYATEQTMVGSVPGFEIAGYDKATLRAFSTRRAEALAWARERNLDERSATVMQQAVLYTRKRKDEPSREELSNIWKARMAECEPRNRRVSRNRFASHTRLDRERWHLERRDAANRRSPSALHAVRRAVEHLEERRTVFTADMLRALVLAPGRWTLDEIDAAIDRLCREGHLVEATAARSDRAFVTDRAVTAERAVLRWMKKESDAAGRFLLDAGRVERHLEAGTLNDGQKAAARTLLLSSRHAVGVQGHAGTGKTTMLRQVVELAGAERIVALAPSSSAARTLQRETGIGTKTLQWFLTRFRDVGDGCADARTLAWAREALEGTLLVVDEASLISMAQMHSLTRITQATGIARVALVGDKAQLRSVEAGQPFRVLQKAGMETAVMDEVLRQRNESLKAAVLHMIEGKPELAIEELGPGVLEMDADELGPRAAALWLDLDPDAREATKVLAPTHARRREITESIREGLKAEGSLHGRTLHVERYVNLHLTRAQKGGLANWREGDVAVFHADVYGVQAKSGDIFGVIGSEGEKVLLKHPDGKTRRADPSKYLRYRVELFETEGIELQAGERIRWTRNDKERHLLNGEEARILSIGKRNLRLLTADGRELTLAHDDPQLHFIDHAWTSTVHAAQGMTCDQVIAVLDADQGAIAGQAAFYVELTRARDNAVLLTDDRDGLVEALETAAGDELSALEAIGHQFREEKPVAMAERRVAVAEKKAIPPMGLAQAKAWREEFRVTLESHLDARLAERDGLLDRARSLSMDGNSALAGTEGHDAWREQALATAGACREYADEGAIAERAGLLEALVAFDDRVGAFDRDRQRHARAARAAGEDVVFFPGIEDLVSRGRAIVDEAPRPGEVPWTLTGYLDMVTHSWARAAAEAAAMAEFGRVTGNLDAAKDERRRLRDLAKGEPLHQGDDYEAWRERTAAALDAWDQANVPEGERERAYRAEARRLREALRYDRELATLLADWAEHEKRASAQGMEALDIAADDPLLTRIRHLVDSAPEGETPPQALTAILARRQARIGQRERAARSIARALDDYADRHARPGDRPELQAANIMIWCEGTRDAITTWRALTGTGERNAALSKTAGVLEDLIAFEDRARDLDTRWREAGMTAHPFLGPDGDALARDLRALEVNVPRHGMMLASLRQALGALESHEKEQARNAERDAAATAVTRALDDHSALHPPTGDADRQRRRIREWCNTTQEAIGAWRAMTDPDLRDPALSETAAVLESLIGFERRSLDVARRLRSARGADGTANPFLGEGGDVLAADLRALEANLPRHGVMLPALRRAMGALESHERAQARNAEREVVAATIARGLDDYRARHALMQDTIKHLGALRDWCGVTEEAIGAWRAMTDPGRRDPALSEKAAVLESLIGFERRSLDVAVRWWNARGADGTANPFPGEGGDDLARDLRALEAGVPRHGMLLPTLRRALGTLVLHERAQALQEELRRAAAAITRALDDYPALHAPTEDTLGQPRAIREWCGTALQAVRAWRAMTDPGARDPALLERAEILESLIDFEERAGDVVRRWWRSRAEGAANPFLADGGDALARDLKRLEADRPPRSAIPHDLHEPLAALAEHEKSAARVRELLRRAAEADDARRSLLEREGTRSRPLNRRLNRAWKRWREAAEAVVADIEEADAAMIARLDTEGVATRVRAERAASDRLDGLPGWLLLRLHDNARDAGSAMDPAMTETWSGIIDEMRRLDGRLKDGDPRRPVLRGEVNAWHGLQETRRRVAELLWELTVHNARISSLEDAAGREALPLRQSLAWAKWYNGSRTLDEQARAVLAGGGGHGRVLHDGQGTRRAIEEEVARFARTRAAHGEPDNSARLERIRKESEEERLRQGHRGRGFSP